MQNKEISITSLKELLELKDSLLQNPREVNITHISGLEYEIKLDGGRFKDYNPSTIDADIAKLILDYQKSYDEFITAINAHFDINVSEKVLKFHINTGCLNIKVDATEILKEIISKMNSWYGMAVALSIVAGATYYLSYSKGIEADIAKIDAQKEISLSKEETERLNLLKSGLEKAKGDKDLECSINANKRAVTNILQSDEVAYINKSTFPDQPPLTHADTFRSSRIQTEEAEHTEILEGLISSQDFLKSGKPFKLDNSKLALNSDIISVDDRMYLIKKAENKEPVTLKVKIIKKGEKVLNSYILEVIR